MPLRTPARILSVSAAELSVSRTCRSGQSFRWQSRQVDGQEEWFIAMKDRTVALRQTGDSIRYEALYPSTSAGQAAHQLDLASDTTAALLRRYFALDVDLGALCSAWSSVDPHFAKKTANGTRFGGIRILRQDAWEATIGFICSSNNHISRISGMNQRLCAKYGSPMPSPDPSIELHSFPTPSALAGDDVEEELRELGFGYRARYVANTAKLVASGGCAGLNGAPYDDNAPLDHLRTMSFADAREALIAFPGVGPKVADCIALFGLAHDHVVPIDTHIWKVATRDYGFRAPVVKGKAKATADGPISKEVYVLVQKDLGEKWGPYAGWKQQILFTSDLRAFAEEGETEQEVIAKVEETVTALVTPEATPANRKRKAESSTPQPKQRKVKTEPYPSPAPSEVVVETTVVDPSATMADRVKSRSRRTVRA